MNHLPKRAFIAVFLIVMATLPLSLSEKEINCDGYCPMYSMEQSLRKFRSSVDDLYSGQEDAISAISRALLKNMMDNNDALLARDSKSPLRRIRPLLLHFTGPTVVFRHRKTRDHTGITFVIPLNAHAWNA